MTKHAKFSPSAAHRWLNCTASFKASKDYAYKESPFAFEGTVAHELAEKCLTTKNSPFEAVGKTRYNKNLDLTIEVTTEMAEHVQFYIDYIDTIKEFCFKPTVYIEESSPILGNLCFGTVDCLIVDIQNKTMHVIDFKYGKGVKVNAYKNEQLMMYALGYFGNRFTVTLHVVQPRITHHVDTYFVELDELRMFSNVVRQTIADIQDDRTTFTPGEKQCLWCPHKLNCDALAEHVKETTIDLFDDINDNDDLRKLILDNKKLIINFLNSIETDVTERLIRGEKFKGYKLVEVYSRRKWNNEAEASLVEKLGKKAYTKKLINITEAQKQFGRTFVDNYTIKSKGKLTLVKSNDKRLSIHDVNQKEILNLL